MTNKQLDRYLTDLDREIEETIEKLIAIAIELGISNEQLLKDLNNLFK